MVPFERDTEPPAEPMVEDVDEPDEVVPSFVPPSVPGLMLPLEVEQAARPPTATKDAVITQSIPFVELPPSSACPSRLPMIVPSEQQPDIKQTRLHAPTSFVNGGVSPISGLFHAEEQPSARARETAGLFHFNASTFVRSFC
jgi:hypothetical protein